MNEPKTTVDAFLERWGPHNTYWNVEVDAINVDDHPFVDGTLLCDHVVESYPPWLAPEWFDRHRHRNSDGSLTLKLYYGDGCGFDDEDEHDAGHYVVFSSMSVTLT